MEGGLSGFYHPDNIHLSDVALDLFNLYLQNIIELAVAMVGCQALE